MNSWPRVYRILVGSIVLSLLISSSSFAVLATESGPETYSTPVAEEVESDTGDAPVADEDLPDQSSGVPELPVSMNTQATPVGVTLNFYTTTGDNFPATTYFKMSDASGTPVFNQSHGVPAISGYFLVLRLTPGTYDVSVFPDTGAMGPQVVPFSQTIEVGPNTRQFSFTVDMQVITASLSFSVHMQDAGVLPKGLTWTIYPAGSWDAIVSGPVTSGSTRFDGPATPLAPGTYQLWVTGNGYSHGQVVEVGTIPTTATVSLVRLQGTLGVNLSTSDGGDIPAGTLFQLTSGSTVVTSYTAPTDLANGYILDLGSVEFGAYNLSISPPAGATGRRVEPVTIPVWMTNAWTPDVTVDAHLEVIMPMADISLSVAMSDDGPIPTGLIWTLFPSGSWDAIATGAVTPGGTSFNHTLDVQVPVGVYQLWITGNGYSSGQVINVQSETFHHGFIVDRLVGNLAITVTTDDGADIPAGTAWEIVNEGGDVVQSGVLDAPLASGALLPGVEPIEFGMYTLNISPNVGSRSRMSLADLPRELLPFSAPLHITNPWFTEYPVTADLQWADSDLTFSVSMSDNGPLPNGLTWMLVLPGSWDPLASGPVTAGSVSFDGLVADPVPYGVYQLWISGNGYSSGQVMNIESPTSHHDFVLDRFIAEVTVVLDTSDDADIPAGTTWLLTNGAGEEIESGTLAAAVADGGMLPITSPLEFDIYTLTIHAEGYHPVTMELALTNPWVNVYAVTASLVSNALPTPSPSPSPSPTPDTPVPTNPATPAPATPAPQEPVTPVTVTTLPQTGSGNGSSLSALLMVGTAIGLLGIVLAADQRRSHRRS